MFLVELLNSLWFLGIFLMFKRRNANIVVFSEKKSWGLIKDVKKSDYSDSLIYIE